MTKCGSRWPKALRCACVMRISVHARSLCTISNFPKNSLAIVMRSDCPPHLLHSILVLMVVACMAGIGSVDSAGLRLSIRKCEQPLVQSPLGAEANHFNARLYFVSSEPGPPFISAAATGSVASVVTPNAIRPLRGLGVVAKIGENVESDDKQFELMRALGVDLVCWGPGEWAGNEKKPGVYTLTPEVRRVISKIAFSNMKMIVVLFRKNALYKNPTDPAAFARYA